MKSILIVTGGLGLMLASLMARPAPDPPLCRVMAAGLSSPVGILREVTVRLVPDCPPDGHAFVRLESPSGASDPVYDFYELTRKEPVRRFLGVLPRWTLKWQAASGATYTVRER